MTRYGIIGLGRMGAAIAQRFASEGQAVQGWTRSGRAVEGVDCTTDLAALTAASDVLILSLYDDTAVGEMLDALLALDLSGKLIIETSTVTPDVLNARIEGINAKGAAAVDGPISGGPELVLAGVCGVFIGGDDQTAARAVDLLAPLTARLLHVGPLGAGLVMKTINNGMLQTYFNGLMEFMPMARKAGLPLETVLRILCSGPAGLPMVTDRIPKALGEDDTVGFAITAAVKDADVFLRVVQSFGLPSNMLTEAQRHFGAAVENGLGDEDPAQMISWAYENG